MITHTLIFAMLAQVSAIEGEVRDSRTHAAIPFATVELFRSQTPVARQSTGPDGSFHFGALPPAHYLINVESSDYDPANTEFDLPMIIFPIMIEITRKRVPRSAEPAIVSLKQLMPKGATKEFDRARQEMKQNNCAEAISHFERGLHTFEKDASAHNDLGNCYRKLNKLDRAEASFKRARELCDSVYVALNLSEVYTAQKRFDDAKTLLNEVIAKRPDAGDVFYGLALVYLAEGRIEDAESAALQAESRPHQIADLHIVLAKLYYDKQNWSGAKTELEAYLKEAPNGSFNESVKQTLNLR